MQSQFLLNNWFGKALGFTSAFVLAPDNSSALSVGVIIGIAGGHLFDRWASRQANALPNKQLRSRINSGHAQHAAGSPYLQFLFAALGQLAKANGQVAPADTAYIDFLMQHLNLGSAQQAQARAWFTKAGDPSALKALAGECLATNNAGLRLLTLRCMCDMAASHPTELSIASLKRFAGLLQFGDPQTIAELGNAHEALGRNNAGYVNKGPASASASDHSNSDHKTPADNMAAAEQQRRLRSAFECLGIAPDSSSAKAKRAYRRLVSRHHPDRLPANATRADNESANARMVELRDALETIQAR